MGKQSLTLHGALRVCRYWQERLGHQDLGEAVPPSAGCTPDFIPKAAGCNSGPPAPTWPASQTTQCEDSLFTVTTTPASNELALVAE